MFGKVLLVAFYWCYNRLMKTDVVVPAVIPERYDDIVDCAELAEPFVKTMQIDLLDGLYTGAYSWPWDTKGRLSHSLERYIETGLPYWEKVDYEFDCMIVHPAQVLEKIIPLGPRRIVVHAKTLSDLQADTDYFHTFRPYVQVGIAFTIEDDLSKYESIIGEYDYVQCMGIYPVGVSHAKLNDKVYDLIKKIRAMYPNMLIQVDGGVNADNIALLKKAGANRFVSGSAVFEKGIIEDNIAELEDLAL